MTITSIICDKCKAPEATTIQYFVERKMDGAGSMDNEYEHIDLCQEHMASLLGELLHSRSHLDITVYLKVVRGYKMLRP